MLHRNMDVCLCVSLYSGNGKRHPVNTQRGRDEARARGKRDWPLLGGIYKVWYFGFRLTSKNTTLWNFPRLHILLLQIALTTKLYMIAPSSFFLSLPKTSTINPE